MCPRSDLAPIEPVTRPEYDALTRICPCGKPSRIWSGLHERGFCSEACLEKLMNTGVGIKSGNKVTVNRSAKIEEARVVRKKDEYYFEQGDIRFHVDPNDLTNVVGSSHAGIPSIIDKLMDSQVVSLGIANGLPVSPYARRLISPVLVGVVQLAWYRDLHNHTSEHLDNNQQKRIATYKRLLADYKDDEQKPESAGDAQVKRNSIGTRPTVKQNLSKGYRFVKTVKAGSGREEQLMGVMKSLKQGTLAQIVTAAEGKVQTKQPLDKIVFRFLKELIAKGAVEAV